MRKVTFLIPASPSVGFFSQIAAFSLALERLKWVRWRPSILVCLGGAPDNDALTKWRPHLRDVALLSVPGSHETIPFYYAQIDGLFRWAPHDADVLVRMDADTLPVGDFEDVLDYVTETTSIGGVIAHYPFPTPAGMTSRAAWLGLAQDLITAPLEFQHSYSLVEMIASGDDHLTPFYLNDGAVFIPRALFGDFARRFLNLRPRLMDRLPDPYYSGQVALTLAVTEMRAKTCALPMRYNFPNDVVAARRFPEELENAKIFHYLRTTEFDRQSIFVDEHNYRNFLDAPLTGANQVFQQQVRNMIGSEYPFGDKSDVNPAVAH